MTIDIRERQFDYGAQRESWQIQVEVGKVKEAVDKQLMYHERRLELWKVRRSRAAGKERRSIKAKEIQVTGGTQTVYESDPNATQAKLLAERKITEHQGKVDDLREWLALLGEANDRRMVLTHADAVFFVLSGYTPDEK